VSSNEISLSGRTAIITAAASQRGETLGEYARAERAERALVSADGPEAEIYSDALERFDAFSDRLDIHCQLRMRRSETAAAWDKMLEGAGVHGPPVLYGESLRREQITRGVISELEHPVLGPVRVLSPAAKLSVKPSAVRQQVQPSSSTRLKISPATGYGCKNLARWHADGIYQTEVGQE